MDLTCYVLDGWSPRIRPASSKRDWMDATPESFAYRCLPLAIANAQGWEVLSPCGFEARWNGGPLVEDVEVRVDEGSGTRVPLSLFGQGTITFHVEGLIRTPPGWNLFVSGSPNAAKDGIAPLGGVIETDWSPYTFTMNWRITRPDHWIRFEENEPFCFFFPVQRTMFEAIQPRILSLDEAPELKQEFLSWSESRNAFQKWVEEAEPAAPSDKWQKLYYRGLCPNGRSGSESHLSKLRVPPFLDAQGAEIAIPEARPVLTRANKILAWSHENAERQRALAPHAPEPNSVDDAIEETGALSSQAFLERFYSRSRPVLMRGAVKRWPAIGHWTPDYLAQMVGSAEIEFQGGRDGSEDFELYKDNHKRRMPFDAFIGQITRSGAGNDAYMTAYNSDTNRAALAPLDADLGSIDTILTGAPGMMWIGPGGTFTPLHFDLTNNLLAQIVGTKHLILLPPSETPRLANTRHVFSEVGDLTDPDRLALYPEAKEARQFEVTLRPGDLLYVPVGWWHQVAAEDFSVMLTYTDFRWPNDAYERFPNA